MIRNLRKFAGTKFAGIVIGIIIIPFVFMGMGNVFDNGNTNNVVKINNTDISTQDFMDYLNQSGLSEQVIRKNVNNNVIEELLSALVSTTLLDLEIKDLDLIISKKALIKKIKKNKNFLDTNGKFKRTLYEKFLLTNSTSAPSYEIQLTNNELQRQLFTYISGGTKSPKFLINKHHSEQNSKLTIEHIILNKFYKNKNEFTNQDFKNFVNENSDKLKEDYIDFSYVNITPKNLIGLEEFNQAFFDKIDEIENKISKNIDFKTIVSELNLLTVVKKNYINLENKETTENKIYNSRKREVDILEDNGSYTFYQINKIDNRLPDLNDQKIRTQFTNLMFQKERFEYNKKILDQIVSKKFDQASFDEFGNKEIEKITLNSIKDTKQFEKNSLKTLYSLPINSFTLIVDKQDNVFIAKIIKYDQPNILQNSSIYEAALIEENAKNKKNLLSSYDYLLNDKYKVIINEKTLDRIKNYFR